LASRRLASGEELQGPAIFRLVAAPPGCAQHGLEQHRGLAPVVTGREVLAEVDGRSQQPKESALAPGDLDRRLQLLADAETIAGSAGDPSEASVQLGH
jgi:hypothetical protein